MIIPEFIPEPATGDISGHRGHTLQHLIMYKHLGADEPAQHLQYQADVDCLGVNA